MFYLGLEQKKSIFVRICTLTDSMIRYILMPMLAAMIATAFNADAQPRRVLRTQFVTYDTREDALADKRDKTVHYRDLKFEDVNGDGTLYTFTFDADVSWSDRTSYLHLENAGSAYTLLLNGRIIANVEDDLTPADFVISDVMDQGTNLLAVIPRKSRTPQIQNSGKHPAQPKFEGSFIFGQRKIHIEDFHALILPDTAGNYGRLHLEVIVANDFNYEEPISVGYDITSPSGKLLDYAVREMRVGGHSRDTLHITTPVYDAPKYAWNPDAKGDAPLYSITLYVKHNSRPEEYIPVKVGYGETILGDDGKLVRLGRTAEIIPHRYASAATRAKTREEITALKKQGINTLITEFPQPAWFYDECDRAGLYVFDRAAINAVENRDDRTVGGTPSNDPAMVGEYIERVDAMYYRMRNHTSVAGFVLGGETGNGYAMYKAYQHLKAVEDKRPVICDDARGEWNTDL